MRVDQPTTHAPRSDADTYHPISITGTINAEVHADYVAAYIDRSSKFLKPIYWFTAFACILVFFQSKDIRALVTLILPLSILTLQKNLLPWAYPYRNDITY